MFSRRSATFRKKYKRKKSNRIALILISLFIGLVLVLFYLNSRLMPIYLEYAEVQTRKIASNVISKAINAGTSEILNVNEIIVEHRDPDGQKSITFNTEVINRVRAETATLVKQYLENAENGELSNLPNLQNVEYDVGRMEAGDGIVFFVPLGQATNLPIIGNLGPKIPIRFHIIGNVGTNVRSKITEFGINQALVEVLVDVEVNVQIIVPLATTSTKVNQPIPVAMSVISGIVPQIYSDGEGAQPSIEVPIKPN